MIAPLRAHSAWEGAGGRPLWRRTAQRAGVWHSVVRTSKYLCRHLTFGIRDMPSVAFTEGEVLLPIPQTQEDKEFGLSLLKKGMQNGIYEEVTRKHAMCIFAGGKIVSSAFVLWKGEEEKRKGRFVMNLAKQSKN